MTFFVFSFRQIAEKNGVCRFVFHALLLLQYTSLKYLYFFISICIIGKCIQRKVISIVTCVN